VTLVEPRRLSVILDLGQVSFIDSAGLGAGCLHAETMPPGSKLSLAGLTPAVEPGVFRAFTRMDSVFFAFSTMLCSHGRRAQRHEAPCTAKMNACETGLLTLWL